MSSIASILGNTGQANYSVANGILDHWARSGTSSHDRTAINWGNWREIGMAVHVQDQLDAMGLEGLKPEDGVRYVGYVLNERPKQVTVSRMDWSSLITFRKDLPSDLLQAQVQCQDFEERPEASAAKDKSLLIQCEEIKHLEMSDEDRTSLRPSGILVDPSRLDELKQELAVGHTSYADLVVKYLPDMGQPAIYMTGNDSASAAASKPETLEARSTTNKLAMLFPGQGAQYPLMAEQFSRVFPAFRDAFDACIRAADAAAAYKPSLREIAKDHFLYLELQKTSVTQILLFAHSYACFILWKSLGIKPDFLIGHSIGELVAVAASGILSLEDAVAVVLKRGEAMERCKGRGAMMALDRAHLHVTLNKFPSLFLAAGNTTKQAVVAGDRKTIDTALAHLKSQKVISAVINEQYPFHTPLITLKDLEEYAAVLDRVTFKEGSIPIVRNVDGKLTTTYTKEDLIVQARSAVLFAPSVATLVSEGVKDWLEAGPSMVLSGFVKRNVGDGGRTPRLIVGTSNGKEIDTKIVHDTILRLYHSGHSIDFDRAYSRLSVYSLTNGLRVKYKLDEV